MMLFVLLALCGASTNAPDEKKLQTDANCLRQKKKAEEFTCTGDDLFLKFWCPKHFPAPLYQFYTPQWDEEKCHTKQNRALLDPFSLTHLNSGLATYIGLQGVWLALSFIEGFNDVMGNVPGWWAVGATFVIATIFEAMENSFLVIKSMRSGHHASKGYSGDSWLNIFGDIVITTTGSLVGLFWDKYMSTIFSGYKFFPLVMFLSNELVSAVNVGYSTFLAMLDFFARRMGAQVQGLAEKSGPIEMKTIESC